MSLVFRSRDANRLYQRLSRIGENPGDRSQETFLNFTRKLTRTRRELSNIITSLESQQSGIRIASGITGTTTLVGVGLSFVFPPVGLGIAALGGAGFLGTQVTDVGLNAINDNRLKPLLDLEFENEISRFLNIYGIDELNIESFREIQDAKYNAVGSLWPEIVKIAGVIRNVANGSLLNDLSNLSSKSC